MTSSTSGAAADKAATTQSAGSSQGGAKAAAKATTPANSSAASSATEGKKVVQEPAKAEVKADSKAADAGKAEPAKVQPVKAEAAKTEPAKVEPKAEPVKAKVTPVKAVPAEPVAKAEESKSAAAKGDETKAAEAKAAESKPAVAKPVAADAAAKAVPDVAADKKPAAKKPAAKELVEKDSGAEDDELEGSEESGKGVTKASPWSGGAATPWSSGGSAWTQPGKDTDDSTLQGDATTGAAASAGVGTGAGEKAWTPTADSATPWNQGAAAQTKSSTTEQTTGQGAVGPWDQGGEQFHGQIPVQPVPTTQPPLSPLSPPFQRPDRSKEKGFPLIPVIAGTVVAVLVIVAGVWYLFGRGDGKPTADPTSSSSTPGQTTGTPTGTPTSGESIPPGQSRNPAIHQGNRIASNAISFPRLRPPWSDRLRFVSQVEDSNGQRVLLQAKFDGTNDWYANIFVGALSTAVLFNGNPQASASDLALQLRSSLYGDIPITAKVTRNGAITRTGKQGWFVQQTITASSSKLTSPTLLLTVAVFDLGDGTAVAYVSDVPTNRNDLKVFEGLVYKAVNVG